MYSARTPQVGWVRRLRQITLALLPAALLAGCQGMNNTDKGVLAGAGVGGVTGGIVGKQLGNTGAGAVIGAAVGGLTGGVIGNNRDKAEQAEARATAAEAAANARPPLSMTDVVAMTEQRIDDVTIINQIRSTGSTYNLSHDDVIYLNRSGVSKRVIHEMQSTSQRAPQRVYTAAPVIYQPVQPVYVAPAPPPPRVGVGFSYSSR